MSAIEWIGASQVTRSATGSRSGRVSSLTSGSSSQASGKASISFAYSSGSVSTSTGGAFVEALQVERVDRAGLDQRRDQLVVPVVGRVELEAQGRVDGEAGQQRLDRGALVVAEAGEAHRGDEVERARLAAEGGGEAGARLAQRQVERRRLEGPAPVAAGDVALRRRGGEEVGLAEQLGELGEAAAAGQARGRAGGLLGDVVDGVVGDVLADPLVPAAAQLDDRGQPFEVAEREFEPLELAGLDLQRQVGDPVEGRHAGESRREVGRMSRPGQARANRPALSIRRLEAPPSLPAHTRLR